MKKIILLFSSVLMVVSFCSAQKFSFKGILPNNDLDGLSVVVFRENLNDEANPTTLLDSVVIKNGTYTLKGKSPKEPYAANISILQGQGKGIPNSVPVIIEEGSITLTYSLTGTPVTVSGAPQNELFFKSVLEPTFNYQSKAKALIAKASQAEQDGEMTPEREEQMQKTFNSMQEEVVASYFNYTKTNIKKPIGEYFFIAWSNMFSKAQNEQLLAEVSPKAKDIFAAGQKRQKEFEDKKQQAEQATAIGQSYKDMTLPGIDGKSVSLSDYIGKNKVVLIDFWASWCGPCIKEMPNVVEAYAKYKGKGFEIVGISFDSEKNAWLAATKKLKITWPQMSDLKGWKSSAGQLYGIYSIPATLLIDQNGKIIAKNLRGKELDRKLAEVLGE
ncbi:peroxiredoxin [Dysgonomonas sp. PH5-45]|uniref:TlpA disulfide reductase family protein n=1 Tax=unclassified Dysgonomonas TaxID=2630389 RepID=UPI002474A0A9|nr:MULTISPECIES: TlpA disulfide reductase family protein [unclassified Dysgonomonas]MDH6355966.1 peroxiredoxin [Dysgonomonas sp. PH5-45]MDH6388861.1 peroxiredoxin [Dysgonomonas sp. PH5-37]